MPRICIVLLLLENLKIYGSDAWNWNRNILSGHVAFFWKSMPERRVWILGIQNQDTFRCLGKGQKGELEARLRYQGIVRRLPYQALWALRLYYGFWHDELGLRKHFLAKLGILMILLFLVLLRGVGSSLEHRLENRRIFCGLPQSAEYPR